MRKHLWRGLLAVWGLCGAAIFSSVSCGAGITDAFGPEQRVISQAKPFFHNGFRVVPLAYYSLAARVLSRRDYRDDRESGVAPVDIAVGWGPVSDEAVLAHLNGHQANRFFNWSMDTRFPLTRAEFIAHHSNMHIIPANEQVTAALQRVNRGDNIQMRGYLVRVESGNWRWTSSLRRDDTGQGACEIMWLESLEDVKTTAADLTAMNSKR